MNFIFSKLKQIFVKEKNGGLSEQMLEKLKYKNELRLEEERLKVIEKEKRSFRLGFKRLTIATGERSSVHCFPSFSKASTFLIVKIVWSLIAMCSWIFLAYITHEMYKNYQSFNVISSHMIGYDTNQDFPGYLKFIIYSIYIKFQ